MDRAGPPNEERPITEMVVLPERLVAKATPLHPREAKYAALWQDTAVGVANEEDA
jgi:hypothetical protein